MPNSDLWRGNVGEWGEAFALLHLLAHNRLFNADSHGHKLEEEYGDVEVIFRTETSGVNLEFAVCENSVSVFQNEKFLFDVPKAELAEAAHSLFEGMLAQRGTEVHPEQELLQKNGL